MSAKESQTEVAGIFQKILASEVEYDLVLTDSVSEPAPAHSAEDHVQPNRGPPEIDGKSQKKERKGGMSTKNGARHSS